MITIPLQLGSPNYEIEIELEQVKYLFRIKYNGRVDCWFIDILSVEGVYLRMGIKMVLGMDLFSGWNDPERPDGVLFLFPKGEPTDPPTDQDMERGRVELLFAPTSEFPDVDPEDLIVENPGPVFFDG